jgi:hypothetical protein
MSESGTPCGLTIAAGQPAAHPLGPVLLRSDARDPTRIRGRAAVVLASCMTLILVGWWLSPDPRGLGTHCQLGLPPCGFVAMTGIPCPTCGMTTAFTHAVRGHLITAVVTQPFGALLALVVMAVAGLSVMVLITARSWRVNWYRVSPGLVAAGVVVLFLASWIYKVIVVCAGG